MSLTDFNAVHERVPAMKVKFILYRQLFSEHMKQKRKLLIMANKMLK